MLKKDSFFYYLVYFCYYSWVSLYFLILFLSFTILFQLAFIFIFSTFSNKFSVLLGGVWWVFSNSSFQFLNNISHISIHFFTHTYFHKSFQTTIFVFSNGDTCFCCFDKNGEWQMLSQRILPITEERSNTQHDLPYVICFGHAFKRRP